MKPISDFIAAGCELSIMPTPARQLPISHG